MIRDWQRCQNPARYGITTGRRELRTCPDHLESLADVTLQNMSPGMVNATAILVWKILMPTITIKCDYRYQEKPDAEEIAVDPLT